ncbi:flavodoxin family protein [Jeotgalibacillus soli]|uniref:Putative NADPH-dependent FMN reductase n=1 Tax=Jeotgalibacillus soli TaxID=889306 RepID=A0A0C2SDX0_9BACL|nr:flavodoxin family protein [Jeotgalibacillus soli]KIL52149.1 putative NADPH-dependent FMN reductase [Jeotgalibacillus soli]
MAIIKALFLNGSLKTSEEASNTDALIQKANEIYEENGVSAETIRLADYSIALGISDDMGDRDEWPKIFEKVKEADILIMATPLWLGEKSSLTTLAIERLYGGSSLTNEKGQAIYYNKIGGAIITGNEDGAKHAAASILYGLSHLGFTIPPNVDTYWVGEAGPGPSYIEAMENGSNSFTDQHVKLLAYNTMHFARLLKEHPIPEEGNTAE